MNWGLVVSNAKPLLNNVLLVTHSYYYNESHYSYIQYFVMDYHFIKVTH